MSHHPQHHLPSPAPSPFPLAPGQEADPTRVRAELEKELQSLAQDLYEMEVCAGEVGTGMEDAVPGYLAKINAALANLAALAPHVSDSVPKSIIENVDKYKNPHQYTKTAISRATGENQYALGRVLGLESFRRQLQDGLSDAFPDLPLPERRHHPVGVDEDEGESARRGPGVGANGTGAEAGAETGTGTEAGTEAAAEAEAEVGSGAVRIPGEETKEEPGEGTGEGPRGGEAGEGSRAGEGLGQGSRSGEALGEGSGEGLRKGSEPVPGVGEGEETEPEAGAGAGAGAGAEAVPPPAAPPGVDEGEVLAAAEEAEAMAVGRDVASSEAGAEQGASEQETNGNGHDVHTSH